MSKRRNEHAHLRKEEYEAMIDKETSSPIATSTRASDETIAKRRIVSARPAKRSAGGSSNAPKPAATNPFAAISKPAEPTSASSNPFAAFTGLAPAAASNTSASANPFDAFKGLVPSAPTPSTSSSSVGTTPFSAFKGLTASSTTIAPPNTSTSTSTLAASTTPKTNGKKFSFPWIESKVGSLASREEAHGACMELLNKEFFSFVQQQIVENPMSLWIKPVQEYIKHVQALDDDLDILYGKAPQVPTSSTPFSFGVASSPKKVSSPKKASFSKKSPLKTSPLKPVSNGNGFTAPTSSGFSFGATSTSTDKPSSSGFSFGEKTTNTPATTGFAFGDKIADKPATTAFSLGKSSDKPVTSGFSFGDKPADKPATSGLSFGSTPADKPSTSGFSFGGATSTSSTSGFAFGSANKDPIPSPVKQSDKPTASSNFSFGDVAPKTSGFSCNATPTPAAPAPAGGFSFNLPASQAPATSTGAAVGDDEDDENIGREEATVIIKSDSETNEAVIFEEESVRLRQFKAAEKEWADLGAHPLKVLQNKTTKATRILVRNSIGKIMVNAALFSGMTIQAKPKSVLIPLMHDGKVINFLFGIPPARISEFKTELEKNIPK